LGWGWRGKRAAFVRRSCLDLEQNQQSLKQAEAILLG